MISRNILVVLVGLVIFVTLQDGSTLPLWLINECPQETSLPCMLGNPETQEVCEGQSASANITLRLPQVIMNDLTLTHVKVLVRDLEFSRGSLVAGRYHDGDERVERWKIKIMFDSDTMIYKVKNAEIKSRDEFVCHLELDIGRQKFLSDPFQWFFVGNCIPPTKPSATEKDTSLLDLALASERTGSIQRAVDCSDQLSEMHELLGNVKTKLDTLQVAVLVLLFLLTAKIFIPLRIQKGLHGKFSGLLDHIRCNTLPSSSTSDHSTVPSQSSSGFASMNQDESSPKKEAKPLLQGDTETLVNLIPSEHSTFLSPSSSSLPSRNQDESSPNKEAKQLLQGDTESTTDVNPSEHSTVRSQSFSGFASRNRDESSPNKEAKQLLQGDTQSLLNLNPSDEDCKIPDAIQKYTNGRLSTDDEQHCNIEMTNIE